MTAFAGEAPVCGGALAFADGSLAVIDGVGRAPGQWPKRGSDGARTVRFRHSVPGHGEVSPVGVAACGGALG